MEQGLSNRIAIFRNGHSRLEQQLENERQTIARLTNKIECIRGESVQLVKAVALLDRCIEVISANGIGKIESIVSAGMHKVFQDDTLGLVVEKKETARGYSYQILIRHGDTIGNPMDSFGGGVQNVAAFLLRVILIKRFKMAKLLVIDESFNNVSAHDYSTLGNYLPQVSGMLDTLTNDHGFTILAITQEPKLAASAKHVYEVVPGKSSPTLRKIEYASISEDGTESETNKAEISG
jgi:DNA repair exonuclease SbcCD ATPase subunit